MARCLSNEEVDAIERDNGRRIITEAGWHFEAGPNLIATIRAKDMAIESLVRLIAGDSDRESDAE